MLFPVFARTAAVGEIPAEKKAAVCFKRNEQRITADREAEAAPGEIELCRKRLSR